MGSETPEERADSMPKVQKPILERAEEGKMKGIYL